MEYLKKCTKCNLEKEFILYHKQKNGKFGIASICKSCQKEYRAEYTKRPEVKEARRLSIQKWRIENPEKQLEISRKNWKKNGHIYNQKAKEKYNTCDSYRLKRSEYDKKYSESGRRKELYWIPENTIKNRLKVKEYHLENKEKDSAYRKKYNELKPEVRIYHTRKRFKELPDSYIVRQILRLDNNKTLDKKDITSDVIETKRLIIKLKRELKSWKIKEI